MFSFNKPSGWETMPLYMKISYYKTQLDHRYAVYVDKLEAKRIVNKLCPEVKTARVIRILKDSNDISDNDLCANHILKATHGSGWNVVLSQAPSIPKLKSMLSNWSVPYVGTGEKQYSHIIPRFFIEEIIDDAYTGKSGQAHVFMIRCIHGKPVSVGIRKAGARIIQNSYTLAFTPIGDTKFEIEKPAQWDAILSYASVLSKPFEFVRIDFYIGRDGSLYFSEFTFTPSGGRRLYPMEMELELGRLWV
jgi:hypothetical protein